MAESVKNRLRLHRGDDRPGTAARGRRRPSGTVAPVGSSRPPEPIENPFDPRWVLAIRVADSLQGVVLPPERRERLLDLGRVMGLTPFDANLIIAIVQDQARRGHAPHQCPQMGEPMLRMVPPPRRTTVRENLRTPMNRALLVAAALATAEAAILVLLY